jgi:hypothetical protein
MAQTQTPNVWDFENWIFGIVWNLVLGAWCFIRILGLSAKRAGESKENAN